MLRLRGTASSLLPLQLFADSFLFPQFVTLNPSIELIKVTDLFEYSINLLHSQASLYQPDPVSNLAFS
jgi:hypothetical protein